MVDRPAIDLLTGGPAYREAVEAGDLDDYFENDALGAGRFAETRRQWLLYS